jgi:uncharacterized protein YbjQ (UPF0145 family)
MKEDQVMISTLENIPGMDIEQHFGMVSASAVMARSNIKRTVSSIKRLFGGEIQDESLEFQKTKDQAIDELRKQAKALGANTIVCLRATISSNSAGLVEIFAYGTAVKAIKF